LAPRIKWANSLSESWGQKCGTPQNCGTIKTAYKLLANLITKIKIIDISLFKVYKIKTKILVIRDNNINLKIISF